MQVLFRRSIALFLLLLASLAAAEEQESVQTYTDPAEADEDFAVQGEYTGKMRTGDGEQVGVQVIALGQGKFHAVLYSGGLPGEGWNRQTKREGDGETRDGVTELRGEKGTGRIQEGVLTLSNADGQEVGRLERVERQSPTLGQEPPEGALVLFDGSTPDEFEGGRLTDDGLLMQGTTSKRKFGDCTLHLEFQTPYMPQARGQARGNSGCYLQGRYEVQILDSFGLEGKNNECGGIYSIRDPDQNMCLPPLAWQTYDLDYTAARFDREGNKTANAMLTVRHNGVLIHENVELPHATTAAPVAEGPEEGPLFLQDHGNPVRFRNIWLIER